MNFQERKKMTNLSLMPGVCLVLLVSLSMFTSLALANSDDLFKAVSRGEIDKVRSLLIEKNVDPNIHDNTGSTPLITATQMNQSQIVRLLLDLGANPDIADKKYQRTALSYAVLGGNIDMVKLLVEKGSDPSKAFGKRGITPLMKAVENEEIFSFLLSEGADFELTDSDGWTTLFYAVSSGNLAASEKLIKAGANINVRDNLGWTPLMYAVDFKQEKAVSLLLAKGADPDIRNEEGKTALHMAVLNESFSLTSLLLASGADANVRDGQGDTALDKAITKGNAKLIELLGGKDQ